MNETDMLPLTDKQVMDVINHKKIVLLIPAITYTVILMVIGLIGNPVAIYIYGWRWQKTTTRNFLLCISIIDLINCLLTMPTEIALMESFFYFENEHVCKMSRFTTYVLNNTTSLILVLIAIDRYIRICRPYTKPIPYTGAFIGSGIAVLVGISVSWPALILYGRREVVLPLPGRNVTGVMCLVKSDYVQTEYPFAFFIYLWIGVTITALVIVIMYFMIGKEVLRRKRERKAKMKLMNDTLKRFQMHRRSVTSNGRNRDREESMQICELSIVCTPKFKPGKSTLMLFAIAVVYLLSFVPFLIVITIRTIRGEQFYDNLSKGEQVVVNIFLRSYLFNNCFNPVVYGLCNSKFRQEVRDIYLRLCKGQGQSQSQGQNDFRIPRSNSNNINRGFL